MSLANGASLGQPVIDRQMNPFSTLCLTRLARTWMTPRTIDPYASTVGVRRKENITMDGRQPGDPARAAEAIIAAVQAETPPFRLVTGRSPVQRFRAELEAQRREIDASEGAAIGPDYPTT
jgi:hypothetical protein